MRTISISLSVACMSAIAFTSLLMPSRFATAAELEEIIVTARKVEESLQDVPISVQAVSGEQIAEQVAESGLGNYVHFLGHRKDVPELLRAIDVFVLPSIGSEGMPLVLLEAMASGVPCVATKLSGIPEIIDTDEVGRLVPIKDENALANAMLEFANMPQNERNEIIEKARERIRQSFDHSVVTRELEGIYEDGYREFEMSKKKTKI